MSYYDRDRNPNGIGGANATTAGTMSHPRVYIGNTAEYLVSGWPYVKTIQKTEQGGTPQTFTVNLNYVTKEIKIQAFGADISLSLQGSTDTFTVFEDTTITLPVKCTTLQFTTSQLAAGITIAAALTNVPASQYPTDPAGEWTAAQEVSIVPPNVS